MVIGKLMDGIPSPMFAKSIYKVESAFFSFTAEFAIQMPKKIPQNPFQVLIGRVKICPKI
jgi:hypothetical protein